MRKIWPRIESLVEYALAFLFIYGGFDAYFANPVNLPGWLDPLGSQLAIYFYAVLFLATGVALIVAKVARMKKLHGLALMTMYLTCVYVLILAVILSGVHWGLTLTVVTGFASAYLWLRWKFKTEYVDPRTFRRDAVKLRKRD